MHIINILIIVSLLLGVSFAQYQGYSKYYDYLNRPENESIETDPFLYFIDFSGSYDLFYSGQDSITYSAGTTISAVENKSGPGPDWIMTTDANRPVYLSNQLNGEPVFVFDTNDQLTTGSNSEFNYLHNGAGGSVAMVVKQANEDATIEALIQNGATGAAVKGCRNYFYNNTFVVRISNGAAYLINNTSTVSAGWHIIIWTYKENGGNDFKKMIDGGSITKVNDSATAADGNSAASMVFSITSAGLNSQVAFVQIFNKELSDEEMAAISAALNAIYAVYE